MSTNVQMIKTPESSRTIAFGYDAATKTFYIRYRSDNSLYEYYDVPQREVTGMIAADSKGKFVSEFIARGYKFECVEKGGRHGG